MSAIAKIRDADTNMKSALLKLDTLRKELGISDTNHDWSKARMFLRDAIDGMPRCACGQVTDLACSDCRIDLGRAVYVCERSECRDAHESEQCTQPRPPSRVTADSISDAQIVEVTAFDPRVRETGVELIQLRARALAGIGRGDDVTPEMHREARARCAEILNTRTSQGSK